jgi:hypothetical protein
MVDGVELSPLQNDLAHAVAAIDLIPHRAPLPVVNAGPSREPVAQHRRWMEPLANEEVIWVELPPTCRVLYLFKYSR